MISKGLIQLLADGWGCAPSLLVVWGDPVLESTGAMVGLMATSKRAQIKGHIPGLLLPVPLSLCREPLLTPPPREMLQHQQAGPSQSPVGSLPLSLGSWCTQYFVPSKTVSLNPVKVMGSNPAAFKVTFPGDSWFLCQAPRLGSLTWVSELSEQ